MIKSTVQFVTLVCLVSIWNQLNAQSVGINSTGATPASSAMLDVSATDKGLLIPRVALTATNVAGPITSPATSLLVYNTATAGTFPNNVAPGYYYWSGSAWLLLLSANNAAWTLSGNAGTTAGTNFIGNTDSVDLVVKTNNTERIRVAGSGNVAIGTATTFDTANPEKLLIDAGTTTSVNAIYAKGTIDSYLQINVQNLSTGTQSSSDLVATADNGTETSNYVNLGINGSEYVPEAGSPIQTGQANDAYLIASGQDFYIANNENGKDIIFVTGGTGTSNERLRILSTGNIGIGTTTPEAKLDISSTTGGLLMPRMTTTQRDAITSPPVSSYIYNTTTNNFNVYTAAGWKSLGYASANQIVVTTLADLPTPVSGAITLDATKEYLFDGIVNINSNYIVLNGAAVHGTDLSDGVMSSATGGVLRSSGQNVFLQNFLVLLAGSASKAYDFSDGTGLLSCVLLLANVADATASQGVGQISGFSNVLIQNCGWIAADGLKLTGTIERFLLYGSLIDDLTSGIGVEFLSGLTVGDVNIGQCVFEDTSIAFKLNAGATVDIGRVNSCILRNVTTPLNGFTSYSPGWEMTANSNIPNSNTFGYLYMNGNSTSTTLSSLNTFVKVAGTTTPITLHKTSNPASNRLTYTGKRGVTVSVFIAISGKSPSTAGAIAVALAKNGTVITAPTSTISGMSNNQAFQIVLDTEVSVVTNDYLEVFIANTSLSNNNYTITDMQFRIVD